MQRLRPKQLCEDLKLQQTKFQVLLFLVVNMFAVQATACIIFQPSRFGAIHDANVVIVGKVLRHEVFEPSVENAREYSIIQLQVQKVFKGELGAQRIFLNIFHWGRALPSDLELRETYILGLNPEGLSSLRNAVDHVELVPDSHARLPTIDGIICGQRFVVPWDSRDGFAIELLYKGRGQALRGTEYCRPDLYVECPRHMDDL